MTRTSEEVVSDPLSFSVGDVVGMKTLNVEGIDGHRTASNVAMSLAEMLELPTNTPYALREESTAKMMRDDVVALVETTLHRRVVAFMSSNHIDPDMAVEVFILEDRMSGKAPPSG